MSMRDSAKGELWMFLDLKMVLKGTSLLFSCLTFTLKKKDLPAET